MHTGGWVVVREDSAVLQMQLVKFGPPARGISDKQHVLRGVEALVAGTVKLAAEAACLVVVQPCCLILKVQD